MKVLNRLSSMFPTRLPVGMTEFNAWADSILELSGKFADEDSMKWALAGMIMHLGPQRSRVAKNYFVASLRKTAANQVAHQFMTDLKDKQQAQQAAKAEATSQQPAEATAPSAEASDGKEA